jgi:two-component system nitrogen regulation sensor histidine kinase NtrY
MKKRSLIPFIVAVASLGAALWLLRHQKPADHLIYYAAQLEERLHARLHEVDTLLANPAFLPHLRAGHYDAIADRELALCLYEKDSLIYYTTPLIPCPSPSEITGKSGIHEIEENFYYLQQENMELEGTSYTLVAAVPIFRTFPVKNAKVDSYFPLAGGFPGGLKWQSKESQAPVRDPGGFILGYLQNERLVAPPPVRAVFLLLLFFGMGGLIAAGISGTFRLGARLPFWVGILLIITQVGVFRLLFWELIASFPIEWLDPLKQSTGLFRVADWWIFDLLLYWISWFSYRRQPSPVFFSRYPLAGASTYYLLASLPLVIMAALIRHITLYTELNLDFSDLFHFRPAGFLAVIGALLPAIPFYLFSQWVVLKTRQLELSSKGRLLSASSGLLLIALSAPGLNLPLLPALLAGIIFITLLDLFADYRRQSLTWLIIWLVFFSAFTAVMFFKYYIDRSVMQMEVVAKDLLETGDPAAESQLIRLAETLAFKEGAAASTHLREDELETSLYREWSHNAHLGLHYTFSILELPASHFASGRLPAHSKRISDKLILLPSGNYQLSIPTGPEEEGQIIVQVQPHSRHHLTVSNQLAGPKMQAAALDYAVFMGGTLVRRQGTPADQWAREIQPPPPGQFKYRLSSVRADLLYTGAGGEKLVLGKSMRGYARPLALFSFLFVVLLLIVLLFAAVLMSRQGRWPFSQKTSLRYRLQLAFIALIIGAFVLIGIVTAGSFRRSFRNQYNERLGEKINAVIKDFQREVDAAWEGKRTPWQRLAQQLSETHQTDIGIYHPDGVLAGSSDPYLYRHGLMPQRVPPAARRSAQGNRSNLYVLNVHTGNLDYRTAFVPIETTRLQAPLFVGIPFLSQEGVRSQDLYALIGTLINVYVFMLLAASSIAIVVANSITQPLDRIGEKLQKLRLGRNEPLEWNSDDEIGQLVEAYNDMIAKLEKRTEALRRSEREGAWREMARQVAHEIKNPLTPMKLSIQHLQRASKADPERGAGLIHRVSQTLVEQIESLSQIASEFSSFAQMPEARNESFLLNELLRSAFDLFDNNSAHDAALLLHLPERELIVRSDKSQMLRVFNNLLKNAIQAIPPDQEGRIVVMLSDLQNKALLEVRDNGSGIPEAMQPKVFYPNFTTKSSGMGLGLAMCKNIVEQTGGRIYFETEEGVGTTFFVEIPLAE